ncbi:5'/3'-nucleotidase SurE [bacterium]|nr:5'/3'-nucleotidase SurE [bacterium]
MKVLIVNDDGIYSQGIRALVENIKDCEILVVAPEHERSAVSHAITIKQPIFFKKVKDWFKNPGIESYAITGTPADCVKTGLSYFSKPDDIDIVISGINHGHNIGVDIHYSGTVSAALEATFSNKCSIAFSGHYSSEYEDFMYMAKYANKFMHAVAKWNKESPLSQPYTININFPITKPYKGIKYGEVNKLNYRDCFEERLTPTGSKYLWLQGELNKVPDSDGFDHNALDEGFICFTLITPYFHAEPHDIGKISSFLSTLEDSFFQ